IKCVDDGGNTDTRTVSFKTESDLTSPSVVRIYNEENNLKVITSEKGKCVFSRENCNYLFDDGIEMQTSDGVNHLTEWNTNINYYIRCADDYGNQPLPNECSIIVRPT
ncbi:MAG: hypothetical protein Q7R52_04110, partial [archaeon]|nr:hypothetical protein [archaeon]